jgi:hypothetical protein
LLFAADQQKSRASNMAINLRRPLRHSTKGNTAKTLSLVLLVSSTCHLHHLLGQECL